MTCWLYRWAQRWDILGEPRLWGPHTHSWTYKAKVCLSESSLWELTLDQDQSFCLRNKPSPFYVFKGHLHIFCMHNRGTAGHYTRPLFVIWHWPICVSICARACVLGEQFVPYIIFIFPLFTNRHEYLIPDMWCTFCCIHKNTVLRAHPRTHTFTSTRTHTNILSDTHKHEQLQQMAEPGGQTLCFYQTHLLFHFQFSLLFTVWHKDITQIPVVLVPYAQELDFSLNFILQFNTNFSSKVFAVHDELLNLSFKAWNVEKDTQTNTL